MYIPDDIANIIYNYHHNLKYKDVMDELLKREYKCANCNYKTLMIKYNNCHSCNQLLSKNISVCRECMIAYNIREKKCIACFANNVRINIQYSQLMVSRDILYRGLRHTSMIIKTKSLLMLFVFYILKTIYDIMIFITN